MKKQRMRGRTGQGVMSLRDITSAGLPTMDVEAFGGTVRVTAMSAHDVMQMGSMFEGRKEPNDPQERAVLMQERGLWMVARSLVGPDGVRMCQNEQSVARMIEKLKTLDQLSINKLTAAVTSLNRFDADAGAALEAAKNA